MHERIQEGNKERIQVFEGLVIAVHKGSMPTDSTVTVRRIASGIGVEKVFLLHSPKIEKIEVKKVAKIRRAKLFFLRGRRGKAARLSERFTTADEFAIAAAEEVKEEASEEAIEEAVVENAKKEEDETPAEETAEAEKEAPKEEVAPEAAKQEEPKEEEVKEESEEVSEEKKEA